MIEVSEHYYDDDPRRGHPDARTRLAGASYFLLGNGLIQAAVQVAPFGEGTPLGVVVMDPDRLGKKREAAGFDPRAGIDPTMIRIALGERTHQPAPGALRAHWTNHHGVPAVAAKWPAGDLRVSEILFCPDQTTPRLAREVRVASASGRSTMVRLRTGVRERAVEMALPVPAGGEARASLVYTLDAPAGAVDLRFAGEVPVETGAATAWRATTTMTFGDPMLDRFFAASRAQLPAAVSARGRMDGSLWQYAREWTRDQAFVALGLTMAGHRQIAATILARLLGEFVTDEGATVDSSEVRSRDDVELDQNGVLLHVLGQYVAWTGDLDLVARNWRKVAAAAGFPLRPEFRHEPSGLLHNSREFWERHRAHGIEPGFELAHQVFVALGLSAAAALAGRLDHPGEARRWEEASRQLREAAFERAPWALRDERGLVKRRRVDGSIQEAVTASAEAGLPPGVPLGSDGEHRLNPDTCTVLPIAWGLVDPRSDLSTRTLASIERLWCQSWEGGGYGRYDVSSEPDSPGAWPFASLFVARAAIEAGDLERAAHVLGWLDTVPGAMAGSWFEFYGERRSPPFPQVGIVPWTWAELIGLLVHHVLGVRPGFDEVVVRPRLLPGLDHVSATMPVRGGRLHLAMRTSDASRTAVFRVNGAPVEAAEDAVRLEWTGGEVTVEAELPRRRPGVTRPSA